MKIIGVGLDRVTYFFVIITVVVVSFAIGFITGLLVLPVLR